MISALPLRKTIAEPRDQTTLASSLFHVPPSQRGDLSPPSSPPPVQLVQCAFPTSRSDYGLSPTPAPHLLLRSHRKTFSHDLSSATQELVFDFEERIAHLESKHTKVSVELEATRDALFNERVDRKSMRTSHAVPHLCLTTEQQDQPYEQTNLVYERKLRDELLASIKKLRGDNANLARSIRELQERGVSLTEDLEQERIARKLASDEAARLSSANFIFLEHNRLLVNRDAALQSDISSLMAKSQADGRMLKALEARLDRTQSNTQDVCDESPIKVSEFQLCDIPVESQDDLRRELVSAQDDLYITERRLNASEQRCTVLSERISSLQKNITLCVDHSAHALEVERELRMEVEGRVQELMKDNEELQASRRAAERKLEDVQPFADAWKRKVGELHHIEEMTKRASGNFASLAGKLPARPVSEDMTLSVERSGIKVLEGGLKTDTEVKMERRERLLDLHLYALASKRLAQRKRLSYESTAAGTPGRKGARTSESFSPTSTVFSTPSPKVSRHKKRISIILAATLSKDPTSAKSGLKTESSLYVDTTSCCDGGPASSNIVATRPLVRTVKTYIQRASAIFVSGVIYYCYFVLLFLILLRVTGRWILQLRTTRE